MKLKLAPVFFIIMILLSAKLNAQWTIIDGPTRSLISNFAVFDSTLFVSNAINTYYSTNRGEEWHKFDQSFNGRINCWIVKSDSLALFGTIFAFFRSFDNGISWQYNYQINEVESLAMIRENTFAACSDGLYFSTDYGDNWKKMHSGPPYIKAIASDGENLLGGAGNAGLFLSTDYGVSWDAINNGINGVGSSAYVNSIYVNKGNIYACLANGLFLSTDHGSNWKSISPVQDEPYTEVVEIGDRLFASCYSGIFYSTNNGDDWLSTTYSQLGGSGLCHIGSDGKDLFIGCNNGGVYRSADNGVNWVCINSNLPKTPYSIYNFTIFESKFYLGTDRGVFNSNDNGLSWHFVSPEISSAIVSFAADDDAIFAGSKEGDVYRRRYADSQWTKITPVKDYGKVSLLKKDTYLYDATSFSGIYVSSNEGESWNHIYNADTSVINCIDVSGKYIFAGTDTTVIRSTDNGKTWNIIKFAFLQDEHIQDIAICKNSIFLGTYFSVYRSDDWGENWYHFETGMNGFNDVSKFSVWGDTVIASRLSDLFICTMGNSRWTRIKVDLSSIVGRSLTIKDSYIYSCGGYILGYCHLSQILTDVKKDKNSLPSEFLLSQNFPNPFNPTTTIEYSIPASSESYIHAVIKVYDVLGREVTTLVNGEKAPGNYEVKFDGSKLASGVYLYRLRAGSFSQTKKFVLMK